MKIYKMANKISVSDLIPYDESEIIWQELGLIEADIELPIKFFFYS